MEITSRRESIILGDFNIPVEKWGESKHTLSLYENLLNSGLEQHVKSPTRGKNILDLIFTTDPLLIEQVRIGQKFSDHSSLEICAKLTTCEESMNSRQVRNFRKGNYERISEKIRTIDLRFFQSLTTNEMYNMLKQTILDA